MKVELPLWWTENQPLDLDTDDFCQVRVLSAEVGDLSNMQHVDLLSSWPTPRN